MVWSVAASVAVVAGIGLATLLHTPQPEDTFSDPYLAYAAIEQAFNRMGDAVSQGAEVLARQENEYNIIENYWK